MIRQLIRNLIAQPSGWFLLSGRRFGETSGLSMALSIEWTIRKHHHKWRPVEYQIEGITSSSHTQIGWSFEQACGPSCVKDPNIIIGWENKRLEKRMKTVCVRRCRSAWYSVRCILHVPWNYYLAYWIWEIRVLIKLSRYKCVVAQRLVKTLQMCAETRKGKHDEKEIFARRDSTIGHNYVRLKAVTLGLIPYRGRWLFWIWFVLQRKKALLDDQTSIQESNSTSKHKVFAFDALACWSWKQKDNTRRILRVVSINWIRGQILEPLDRS